MVEDRDSERLTDVVDAVGPHDDDPYGMRVGPGTEVGGYIVDGELGHGAMGVVYSATHPVIGKRAAIKILRPEVSQSPIAVERFIQEARAVNRIGHPNIVDIFAYGALPDGRAYHVMDLLVGESLRKRLKRGVLHPSEAASVIDEMASALIAAHDSGFVHRDLKPDNVFLVTRENRWPEVKLLDFGLAKLMPEYGVPAFVTKTGMMLGTPEYMSPEQARGHRVDYRTDIYALGIVMFEILAGSRPFPPIGEAVAVLMQHAEEPPLSLADTVPGLPHEMVQLVDAMLAKTPEARPSLAAVRAVIKRLRSTQLPTRSVAGAEMSSFHQLAARPDLAITASRVGAEAVLPGDPATANLRRPVAGPAVIATPRAPSTTPAPALAPLPARGAASSAPDPTPHDLIQRLAAAAPFPSSSKPDTTTRGIGVNAILASQPGLSRFKVPTPSPDLPRIPPVGSQPLPTQATHATHATQAPGASSSAASAPRMRPPTPSVPVDAPRPPATKIQATALGMGPPAKQAPAAPVSGRARRWWLVAAALLVVAAAAAVLLQSLA